MCISRVKHAYICMYMYMRIHTLHSGRGDVCLKIVSESNGKLREGRNNSRR